MKKIFIIGGRSFLGNEFSKYLDKKKLSYFSINENNSDNYSISKIKYHLHKEKPSIIVDFKFPVVSSNDDDFRKIKEKKFFTPQNNLFEAINSNNLIIEKFILISSIKASSSETIYSIFKKKQEDLYENYIDKNKLSIIRVDSVFGPGDLSETRLIPNYFRNVLKNYPIKYNFNKNDLSKFIYILDALEDIYFEINSEKVSLKSHKISFINLIKSLNFIMKKNHYLKPSVLNNNVKLDSKNMIKNEYFFKNLENTASWYKKNLLN